MSVVTEEGILLRSHLYSESSRILRFLTPGHGILSVMAKGLRRRSSKGEAGVATFDQASLVLSYRTDRDLHTLRDVEVIRSRRALGRNLSRFAGASLVAEMVLAHTLHEANPALFELVEDAMDRMQHAPARELPGTILAAAWGVLREAGYPPVLDECARCGGGLPSEALLRFSAAAGGLLCTGCGTSTAGARLGPGAREDLARLARGQEVAPLRGGQAHLGLLEAHALHHLSPRRRFASVELLRPLLDSAAEDLEEAISPDMADRRGFDAVEG